MKTYTVVKGLLVMKGKVEIKEGGIWLWQASKEMGKVQKWKLFRKGRK